MVQWLRGAVWCSGLVGWCGAVAASSGAVTAVALYGSVVQCSDFLRPCTWWLHPALCLLVLNVLEVPNVFEWETIKTCVPLFLSGNCDFRRIWGEHHKGLLWESFQFQMATVLEIVDT